MSSFYRREKGAFFSYSHADEDLAMSIVEWLRDKAEVDPWFDRTNLPAGVPVRTTLGRMMHRCRSLMLLLSPHSLRSDWVDQEWEMATEEEAHHRGFRRIALVHPDLDPDELKKYDRNTWVPLPKDGLDAPTAAKILSSLRQSAGTDDGNWDVFITRTWRDTEDARFFADRVCSHLDGEGFRLIGDEPRDDDDPERLRAIIASCQVHVAIVPPRPPEELVYLLNDLAVARDCGLPTIVLVDPEVLESKDKLTTPEGRPVSLDDAAAVVPVAMPKDVAYADVKATLGRLSDLVDHHRKDHTPDPYVVVFAADEARVSRDSMLDIDRVVLPITGRKCTYPHLLDGEKVSQRMAATARDALILIADVTAGDRQTWAMAGIARGAERPVRLISSAAAEVPAVFQDNRPRPYRSDVDRVGLVHATVYPYRRWFMNAELGR